MINFRIYANDDLVYDPFLVHAGYNVLSPKLSIELNKSGSLTFTIPPEHTCYNTIQKLSSIVRVYLDNTLIFKGRVMYDERDFYNRKQIYCEGALSFLMDSQMRPFDITCDIETFLGVVLANHNNYVDQDKWLEVGDVTVLGSGTIEYNSTDYESSLDVLTKNLLDKYAGYIRLREEYDDLQMQYVTYVDYLSAYETASTQAIEFGANLLDLKEHISAEEVFTVLIPLGAKEKDGEGDITGRLTIESVNDGKDYLVNSAGVSLFGKIEKTQVWDDITTPEVLLTNAQAMLASGVNTATTITIKAVDLHMTDDNIASFILGDLVRVISAPHGLDTQFQITKIDYDITSPDQTVYTFSADFGENPTGPAVIETGSGDVQENIVPMRKLAKGGEQLRDEPANVSYYALDKQTKSSTTLTEKMNASRKQTTVINSSIDQSYNASLAGAHDIASNLINSGFGGYVYITPDELYIMNTNSIETATKVWRWNLGGLGYWTGAAGGALGGTYGIAITQDGGIKGDYFVANSIQAASIKDATGTDWLTKINTMLAYASEGHTMSVGSATMYGTADSVTFGFSTNHWVRLYHTPATWYDASNNPCAILIVFRSGSTIRGLADDGTIRLLVP